MKKWMIVTLMLLSAGWMFADIGWVGGEYPETGSSIVNGNDIDVYYEIWKDEVTNNPGQGAGITSTLYYKKSGDAEYQSILMIYNTDVGNNDEYVGTIPNSFFYTGDVINFYCVATDGTPYTTGVGSYTITAGLNQSVTVTFSVYMGNTSDYSGGVSLVGSSLPLTWSAGDLIMTDPDENLIYTVDVEFSAGTNPSLEYKYTKNDGSTWVWELDGQANRSLTIDDNGLTQTLDPINTFDIKNTDYANGWFEDFLTFSVNNSPANYWIGTDPGSETALNGHDFGAVSSLVLTDCAMKYWSNTIDRSGGAFGYKIMSEDGNTQVVAPVLTSWDQTKLTGNDYQGTKSGLSINLLSGLEDVTTYQLHVWAKSDGVVQSESYLSNNSANYVATFTTPDGQVPITLASFTAQAVQGVVKVIWVTESETENDHFVLRRNGEVLTTIDGAGTTTEPHTYEFIDRLVEAGRIYSYVLSDVSYGGVETEHDPVIVEIPAGTATESFALEAAYPNPFNPQTTIRYRLGTESHVDLAIYNTSGMRIATLFSGEREAGSYQSNWHAGNMSSGIYLIRMIAEGQILTQKVILMK